MREFKPGRIAVIGVPFDEFSSVSHGSASAPRRVRGALRSPASNLCAQDGSDLEATEGWCDLGDLELPSGEAAITEIEEAARRLIEQRGRIVALGGDHSISYPLVRACAQAHPGLTVVQIDAHPDLYDSFEGNRLSHACAFARVMEEAQVERLIQVGIRASNPHQRRQAERFGVETIEMADWRPDALPALRGPVYLSVDLDGLDPAFAPAVAHPVPGGLTTREVLQLIRELGGSLVGADIVELQPDRDPGKATAVLAACLLKEIVARMLADER